MKVNYEKARTLIPLESPGIAWYSYEPWETAKKVQAKIITYREFLAKVKSEMDKGKLPKTLEYGWRDGNEKKVILYTDFLIHVENHRTGLRVGFDAVESYNPNTKARKYVRPNKSNARFWNGYIFE